MLLKSIADCLNFQRGKFDDEIRKESPRTLDRGPRPLHPLIYTAPILATINFTEIIHVNMKNAMFIEYRCILAELLDASDAFSYSDLL